ncbi:MAG: MlaC/ttg2D family ABC transporter substrate-binding protein [Gammaproteobacteria bacterium]
MMTRLISALFVLGALVGVSPVWAQDGKAAEDAVAVVRGTSEKMIETLKAERENIQKDPARVRTLVEEIVVPHFDSIAMSQLVLGKHWRRATKDEKIAFIRQFRTLLIHTYSSALSEFKDEVINYKEPKISSDGERVTVRTEVVRSSGPEIPIDYLMRFRKDQWKVNDVLIDGISLITNYRASFSEKIRKVGLDGLIGELEQRNADTGTRAGGSA